MFKKLAIAIVAAVVAVLAYAATRPDLFHVERATLVDAPPEKIFARIDDFEAWSAWSPYEKRDPAMKKTHSGAASGKGAIYEWDGNQEVGSGRMEIIESIPPSRIAIQLDFATPFEAHNIAVFTLKPEGSATHVEWAMHGPSPFIAKLMGLFFDMDAMIGKDFEDGLASLKALAEKSP